MDSKEETKKTETVLINGQEHNIKDLTQQQVYFLNQITDLDGKTRSIQFNLDQTATARAGFYAQLNASLESEKPAEEETSAS